MPAFDKALVSLPGKERLAHPLGDTMIIHATAEETNGAVGIFEGIISARGGVDLHRHTKEDEVFRVIQGRFRFWCGNEVFEGGPGTTIVAPRNVPHRWLSLENGEARLLCVVTPGGFESFFKAVADAEFTPEAFKELSARYGLVWGDVAA